MKMRRNAFVTLLTVLTLIPFTASRALAQMANFALTTPPLR